MVAVPHRCNCCVMSVSEIERVSSVSVWKGMERYFIEEK